LIRLRERGPGSPQFGPDTHPNLNLPGGENYRELLLTLPEQTPSREVKLRASPVPVDGNYRVFDVDTGRLVSTITADSAEDAVQRTRDSGQALFNVAETSKVNFTGGHYDEPNVLAHVRFNEREIDGQRVLFIEEMQSDWHAKGRDKGYQKPVTELPEGYTTDIVDMKGAVRDRDGMLISTAPSVEEAVSNALARLSEQGVPDAPLKKNWHEMAFRRMVRWAAENDFDRIAWTTGKQQADRYDLSKQVDRISWDKQYKHGSESDTGQYSIGIFKDGKPLMLETKTDKELASFIGKDLAGKITGSKEAGGIFEGLDLAIGGEGLKSLYDNMIPNYARKFNKKGKFDAVIEDIDIGVGQVGKVYQQGDGRWRFVMGDRESALKSFETKAEAEALLKNHRAKSNVHSMTITPKMRDTALNKGFPLFSRGPAALGLFPTGREEQE